MKLLIVEDEKVAARRLERMVREVAGDSIESLDVVESLQDSERFISQQPIDVLLLDLNLNGESGFSLLRTAAAGSFQTIIVSANTDRAIEAYEYGVLDFVPKPFDKERITKAFERLHSSGAVAVHAARTLVVRKQGSLELIPIDTIKFFKGAGDYAEIHRREAPMVLHSKSLESLERILPAFFARVHKSYIVDLREITAVHVYGGGKYELELADGATLPVSRNRYKDLTERLTESL